MNEERELRIDVNFMETFLTNTAVQMADLEEYQSIKIKGLAFENDQVIFLVEILEKTLN